MTLFITFAPANHNILAWLTLHFAMLHQCTSSMLYCKPNTHSMQGHKNDYTHTYSHPLSNLLSFQSPFWSLSDFLLLNYLVFIFTQLPLVNRRLTTWSFNRIWLFSQSTLQKTQCTLHILKLSFLFFFLRLLWPWIGLLVWWSSVGVWYLTTTPTLCSFMPLFATVVALPTELPLWNTQLHRRISSPILLYRD